MKKKMATIGLSVAIMLSFSIGLALPYQENAYATEISEEQVMDSQDGLEEGAQNEENFLMDMSVENDITEKEFDDSTADNVGEKDMLDGSDSSIVYTNEDTIENIEKPHDISEYDVLDNADVSEEAVNVSDSSVIVLGNTYSRDSANFINYEQWYTKTSSRDDHCYVKFVLPENGYIVFDGTMKYYYEVILTNQEGKEVFYKDINTFPGGLGLSAGTYFLDFYNKSYSNNIRFKLSYNATEYTEIEPNNVFGNATNLEYNHDYIGCINSYDDKEYFKISANQNEPFVISIGNYENISPYIYLYKSDRATRVNNTKFVYDSRMDRYIFSYIPDTTGDYYLEISAPSATGKFYNIAVNRYSVSSITDKTYTGEPITQDPIVKVGDYILNKDIDYTLSYENNLYVGTAVLLITGNGNYTSTMEKPFQIIMPLGIAQAADGNWYYYKNNTIQRKTDVVHGIMNGEEGWWYVNSEGKVDTSFSGMAKSSELGWIYVTKGKWDTGYTGMAKNDYGWWYMKSGKLDSTYTGMAKNAYGWWYMKNGKLDQTYTGMAKNAYGWWYMKNGKLDQTYTGMAKNAYGWWYMKNGKLDQTYIGMAKNAYGWWYMKSGKLDTTFTGIAQNEYGSWYMVKGKLASNYNGKVSYNSKTYSVKNGKATKI